MSKVSAASVVTSQIDQAHTNKNKTAEHKVVPEHEYTDLHPAVKELTGQLKAARTDEGVVLKGEFFTEPTLYSVLARILAYELDLSHTNSLYLYSETDIAQILCREYQLSPCNVTLVNESSTVPIFWAKLQEDVVESVYMVCYLECDGDKIPSNEPCRVKMPAKNKLKEAGCLDQEQRTDLYGRLVAWLDDD